MWISWIYGKNVFYTCYNLYPTDDGKKLDCKMYGSNILSGPATGLQFGRQLFKLRLEAGRSVEDPETAKRSKDVAIEKTNVNSFP